MSDESTHGDEAEGMPPPDPTPEPASASKRRKRPGGRPLGDTLGGILVGFDQQIMRTLPPPHELVVKGSPVRGLSGEGLEDDDLVIVLPGDASSEAGAADDGAGDEPTSPG